MSFYPDPSSTTSTPSIGAAPADNPLPPFSPIPGYVFPPTPPSPISSQTSASTLARTSRKHAAQQATVAGIGTVLPLIYGRQRIGARVCGFVGTAARDLYLIAVWGQGEVDAIESVSVDDTVADSRFTFRHYTGTLDQEPDLTLVAAYLENGIDFADAMAGTAYTVCKMEHRHQDDHFPRLAAIVRGLKVRDSDGGVPFWSDNPAYCIADFITNSVYGMGRRVDWSTVSDLAATCDELVGDVQERRRILNLSIDNAQPCETWLQVLRDYAGCWIVPEGGSYRLIPDRPGTSSHTFDSSNIIEKTLKIAKRGTRTVPTAVEVAYTETGALPWRQSTTTAYAAGVLGGSVPFRRSRIDKPGILRKSEAYRYAVERLNEGVFNDVSIAMRSLDAGVTVTVGDIVTASHPTYMPTATLFRVTKADPIEAGRWQLSCTKYDVRKYDDTAITGDPPPVVTPPPPGGQNYNFAYTSTTILTNMAMFLDEYNKPYWISDFGVDWDSTFPNAMSTYTDPIASYHAPGVSRLVTNHADFLSQLTGKWTADAAYQAFGPLGVLAALFGLSPDDTTFTDHPMPGPVSATDRYARNDISTDGVGSLLVTGLGAVHVNISTVREQGQIVTSASTKTTVKLAGKYSTEVGAAMTPVGTASRTGSVDRIMVNPDVSGVLQYNSFITGAVGSEFRRIKSLAHLVSAGDKIVYDVFIPHNFPKVDGVGAVDFFDNSSNSASVAGCVDQNGDSMRVFPAANADGVWFTRVIDLTPIAGSTFNPFTVCDASGVVGNHGALYRNIKLVDNAFALITQIYAAPGEPTNNVQYAAFNADPGDLGQANAFDVYLFDSNTQAQVAGPGVWTFDGIP